MGSGSNSASMWAQRLKALLDGTCVTDASGKVVAHDAAFDQARVALLKARTERKKVMVIGNGGSAAIASHLQTDLAHSLGIRALVFTEPSVLTAQANDHGYETAFRNLVALWADAGDLLIAVSSSGRSPNILKACQQAKAAGCGLITFSGFGSDNPLRSHGDLNFFVSSCEYGEVESTHAVLIHHLTDRVLETLKGESE